MRRLIVSICAIALLTLISVSAFANENTEKQKQTAECAAALSSTGFTPELKKAAENFDNFFRAIETQLFERNFFLEVSKLALLAKEHVLMLGPPGNAKSMGVDLIIDNIVDADSAKTSVFKIQMTPETSLSETHGVIDYKKITEENIQTRKWEQGLLSAKLVFIDEFFDARANAIRNNLMALNEREHAQGRERIKGETETGFAASNKYIHEVYEKAGDDGPKAIIDRFAFVAFVPGELAELRSALSLIGQAPTKRPGQMTFQDLDLLRAKLHDVKIPDYVGQMLTLMFTRMKAQTESLEESEKKRFLEQKKSGLSPLPPYRSTKYFSPRTLRKAGKVLRAIVLNDWIKSGGDRPLIANSQDLERMVEFFTLNSMDEAFLTRLEESTVNPYEKIQVMTVLKEKSIFREIYQELMSEVNAHTSVLTEIEVEREAAVTAQMKKLLVEKMIVTMTNAILSGEKVESIQDLTEANIANDYIRESLESSLREMLGSSYETDIAEKILSMEQERERRLKEERRLEKERLAKERAEIAERERTERRLAEERAANMLRMGDLKLAFNDPARLPVIVNAQNSGVGYPLFNASPIGDGKWEIFSVQDNSPIVETLDLTTGKVINRKTFPRFEEAENFTKITRIAKGRFLLWHQMYGRVFDKSTGLFKRKVIHETNSGQVISDNSTKENTWLFDTALKKVGVMKTENMGDIDWHHLTAFSFSNPSGLNVNLEHLLHDIKTGSRVFLSEQSGVAHVFSPASSANGTFVYKIDLNDKIISPEKISNPGTPDNVVASPQASAGTNFAAPTGHFFSRKADPVAAQKFDLQFGRYDLTEGRKVSGAYGQVDNRFLAKMDHANVWAVSPDGSYIVAGYGSQLFGYDLLNGEEFPIQIPLSSKPVQLHFLDAHHLMVVMAAGHLIVRLPTVRK